MKYLKYFENKKFTGPQKDDFVILKFDDSDELSLWIYDQEDEDKINFFSTNIGKITFAAKNARPVFYSIEYKNMPEELKLILGNTISVNDKNIVFYSKRKKDVEVYLTAIKYNL